MNTPAYSIYPFSATPW